jgi:hypothetical protein
VAKVEPAGRKAVRQPASSGNLFQRNRLNRSFVTICYTQISISMATLAGGILFFNAWKRALFPGDPCGIRDAPLASVI